MQMKIAGKHILLIVIVIVFFTACHQNNGPVMSEITISGKMSNASDVVIHLSELDVKTIKSIDSVTLDEDGRFSFKIKPAGSMFLLISAKPGEKLILIANPGEKIHLEANASELIHTASISGSAASLLLLNFERFTQRNKGKVDSIGQVFLSSRSDPDFATIRQHLDSAYQATAEDQRRYMERFINQYPSSLASLIVLNQKFGPNAVFTEDKDIRYFQKLDSGLMAVYPSNKHVLDHHSRIEALIAIQHKNFVTDSLLTSGMQAPDLRLNTIEGKPVSLSSLKGKIVLVYFWAAMDATSRKFIRQMIPIYQANRNKGLEIYGMALEPNNTLWRNAVKLDNPGGIQVNAGNGINAPEASLFGIKSLPAAILIDRQGKIMGRNLCLDEIKKLLPALLK
jgi:hypothetical protein